MSKLLLPTRHVSRKQMGGKIQGKKIVGTPDYMAPETLDGSVEDESTIDWWAIGCIIYEFIVGIPPFNDQTVEAVWKNIRDKKIEWPEIGSGDDQMTPEAKDLIERLLDTDPKSRMNSITEAKNHPFFKGILL